MRKNRRRDKKTHFEKEIDDNDIWEEDDWLHGSYTNVMDGFDKEFGDLFSDDNEPIDDEDTWDDEDYILMGDDDDEEDEDDY
jgi:hypothetical protein